MPQFKGNTSDRRAPILGAKYWKKGVSLTGTFVRAFPTANGECYEFELGREMEFPGDVCSPVSEVPVKTHRISVGAMKGFMMAVADSGCGEFKLNDRVTIECQGAKDSGKQSEMVLFSVFVDRR